MAGNHGLKSEMSSKLEARSKGCLKLKPDLAKEWKACPACLSEEKEAKQSRSLSLA